MRSFLGHLKGQERPQLSDDEKVHLKKVILQDIIVIWRSSGIPIKDDTAITTQLYKFIDSKVTLANSKMHENC